MCNKILAILIVFVFLFDSSGNCLRIAIDAERRVAALASGLIDTSKVADWDLIVHPEKEPLKFAESYSGARGIFGKKERVSEEGKIITMAYAYTYAMDLFERWKIKDGKKTFKILVGRDTRITGKTLSEFQIIGIKLAAREMVKAGVKVEVIDLGIVTTPFIEASVRELEADGGVIVTASHNNPKWNGLKYLTGLKEPEESLLNERGGILNGPKMRVLIGKTHQLLEQIASSRGQSTLIFGVNRMILEGTNSQAPTAYEKDTDMAFGGYRKCIREVFRLKEEKIREIKVRNQNEKREAVYDANGSGGYEIIPAILGDFITVNSINTTPGRFRHKIEPIDRALKQITKSIKAHIAAMFGLVVDCDADRGNLVIKDLQGNVRELHPQEVTLLNVACMLAWVDLHKELYADKGAMDKPWRVVVHSATSGRVAEIAIRFGAEVVEADIGEANIVTKMHELEKEGFFVPIGVEGYNGGTIFMGTEVRDGTLTALMSILALSEKGIFQRLSEKMGMEDRYQQFSNNLYSLEDILDILPRYNTVQGDLTSDDAAFSSEDIKNRIEDAFRSRIRDVSEGIFQIDGMEGVKFKKYELRYFEETRVFINKDDRKDKTGGFKIVLTDIEGREHFLWFRGSKTQPSLFRIASDSSDYDLAKKLAEFQESLYKEAIGRHFSKDAHSSILRPPMTFSRKSIREEQWQILMDPKEREALRKGLLAVSKYANSENIDIIITLGGGSVPLKKALEALVPNAKVVNFKNELLFRWIRPSGYDEEDGYVPENWHDRWAEVLMELKRQGVDDLKGQSIMLVIEKTASAITITNAKILLEYASGRNGEYAKKIIMASVLGSEPEMQIHKSSGVMVGTYISSDIFLKWPIWQNMKKQGVSIPAETGEEVYLLVSGQKAESIVGLNNLIPQPTEVLQTALESYDYRLAIRRAKEWLDKKIQESALPDKMRKRAQALFETEDAGFEKFLEILSSRYDALRQENAGNIDPGHLEFLDNARGTFAEVAGIRENQIIFVSPDDVFLWALASAEMAGKLPAGIRIVFSDEYRNIHSIIMLPYNGSLDKADVVYTLSHEAGHCNEAFLATRRYAEPFIGIIIEGRQRSWQYDILSKLKERLLIEARRRIEEGGDYRLVYQIIRLLNKSMTLVSYPRAEKFVSQLIELAGKEAIDNIHKTGEVEQLANALGKERFEALLIFFREWGQKSFLHSSTAAGLSIGLAMDIAEAVLLKGDSGKLRLLVSRLREFMDLLQLQGPLAGEESKTLEQIFSRDVQGDRDNISQLAVAYAKEEVDLEYVKRNLYALHRFSNISALSTSSVLPADKGSEKELMDRSGIAGLSFAQVQAIQDIVNRSGVTVMVVGSAAADQTRLQEARMRREGSPRPVQDIDLIVIGEDQIKKYAIRMIVQALQGLGPDVGLFEDKTPSFPGEPMVTFRPKELPEWFQGLDQYYLTGAAAKVYKSQLARLIAVELADPSSSYRISLDDDLIGFLRTGEVTLASVGGKNRKVTLREVTEYVMRRDQLVTPDWDETDWKGFLFAVKMCFPDNPGVCYDLGRMYCFQGRYNEAEKALKKAIKADPNLTNAYVELGIVYAALGNHYQAIQEYEAALALRPTDAIAYYDLAKSHNAMGNTAGAIKAYEAAIRLNPKFINAYWNIALLYHKLYEIKKAINNFAQAVFMDPVSINEVPDKLRLRVQKRVAKIRDIIQPLAPALSAAPDGTYIEFTRGLRNAL